jgi:anti-anti-sigma factor
MKPHQIVMAGSVGTRTECGAAATVANKTQTTFNTNARYQPASEEPGIVAVRNRRHTLILTGELTRGSARALEAEIERLCEQGVSGITLDLRELASIDPIGVAVIAFRSGLCQRRGYDFAVIPGSRFVHRVFEQAGATDVLSFREEHVAA